MTTSADSTKVRVGGTTATAPGGQPPSPGPPKRRSPCRWISWDESGRPSCEHGPAHKQGPGWRCREKHNESRRIYERSEKGKIMRARANQQPHQKSRKAWYEQFARVRSV